MSKFVSIFSTVLAVSAAVAVSAAPGKALESSQYAIGLSGTVPVICNARLNASVIPANAGVVQLGNLVEFCNSSNGYRVVAEYPRALAGAKLIVDGKAKTLGNSGIVEVSSESGPSQIVRTVALDLNRVQVGSAISFRIETR